MRHFDAHAYRTEDADGVWDFARGCMRTYLILAEKAAPVRRGPRDPGGARRRPRPTRLAEPTSPDGLEPRRSQRCARSTLRRRRARRPGLRPRAPRPARHRAAARRPLAALRYDALQSDLVAHAAGRRGRLLDAVHEGRGPRRRHRRAGRPTGARPTRRRRRRAASRTPRRGGGVRGAPGPRPARPTVAAHRRRRPAARPGRARRRRRR